MRKINQIVFTLLIIFIFSFNLCLAASDDSACLAKGDNWSCEECGNNCSAWGCVTGLCSGGNTKRCCPKDHPSGGPSLSSGSNAVRGGLSDTANVAGLTTQSTPKSMITDITGYALGFVGVIVFLNILFAGYQWITAGGNEEIVTKAKTRIKNSIIGLIIVLAAYAITRNLFTIVKDVAS